MEVTLRPWNQSDLTNLVTYANNEKIARYMTNQFPFPYTPEAGSAFIEFAMNHPRSIICAIDNNGQAIGGIGLHPQQDIYCKNAELGYWLAEPFWGQGIMSKAVTLMVQIGFSKLDLERIYARPFGTNTASQKVLEKCGFNLEAHIGRAIFKGGEYEDELIYGIRK